MTHANTRKSGAVSKVFLVASAAALTLFTAAAHAAAPGVTSTGGTAGVFNLDAGVGYSSQPDGELIYSWGYGCNDTGPTFAPAQFTGIGFCPPVQLPGPTLIVTEGAPGAATATFTVTLTNSLPTPAGNTSIIFPGLATTTNCGAAGTAQGLMTCEALPGGAVTYTVSIPYGSAGTHIYQSGTQPDLQIEMGMFGAVVVLPYSAPANCTATETGRQDYRLAPAAYDHALTCYDREYLFQWSEMDPRIHKQAESQVAALIASGACPAAGTGTAVPGTCHLDVATEPYHPNYFLINGRSMPDLMDPDYAPNYPIQPYNANPHMHPGELILVRTTGQGHWQHPFHEHANHVRILARDAHLLLAQANDATPYGLLAGRMEFDTDTTPGQAFDGIFYWTGKGLGWDIFGHTAANASNPPCIPDVNGYYTVNSGATIPSYDASGNMIGGSPNYYEWCQDHDVPLEANPVSTNVAGTVAAGGPMTLFDPLVATNGLWYNGTPYLGPDAVNRSRGPTPLPPGAALQNPPAESGIFFMWHSHNEREITTSDVFPGGMLMMMGVDPYVWNIDETL
jgi:FtsP/CotA-like multicopper oxidase with cupredoxin domain